MFKPFAMLALLFCAPFAIAAGPTTQPANPFSNDTVIVRLFQPVGPAQNADWVAQAIQQSMMADLSRGGVLQAVAYSANDDQSLGTQDGRFMILGNYQILDTDLRITGLIWDLQAGSVIGSLKATGQLRDLFMLEDTLGNAARTQILNSRNPKPDSTQQTGTPVVQQQQPQQIVVTIQNSGPVKIYEGSDLARSVQNYTNPPSATYNDYNYNYNRYYYNSPYQNYYGGYWGGYGYGYGGWYNFNAWPGYIFAVNRCYYSGNRPYCR